MQYYTVAAPNPRDVLVFGHDQHNNMVPGGRAPDFPPVKIDPKPKDPKAYHSAVLSDLFGSWSRALDPHEGKNIAVEISDEGVVRGWVI